MPIKRYRVQKQNGAEIFLWISDNPLSNCLIYDVSISCLDTSLVSIAPSSHPSQFLVKVPRCYGNKNHHEIFIKIVIDPICSVL